MQVHKLSFFMTSMQSDIRTEVLKAVQTALCTMYCLYTSQTVLTHIFVIFLGVWHQNFFTNGDVIDLLSAIDVMQIKFPRKKFYEIVSSRCPTSMTSYKLMTKAVQVKGQRQRRKSRRRSSYSTNSTTGIIYYSYYNSILTVYWCTCDRSWYWFSNKSVQVAPPQNKETSCIAHQYRRSTRIQNLQSGMQVFFSVTTKVQ